VRIVGVTEDVVSGTLNDGLDTTCVYFATGLRSPGEVTLLVRGRTDMAALRTAVTAAVNAVEPDAPFQFYLIRELLGGLAWVFQALSVAASLLGAIGLILAFSGTYGVVAFLVSQRTREFGVRMALGATVARIVSSMVAETFRTASVGLAAGLATAVALVRAAGSVSEIIPTFGLRPYAVGTAIVLVSTIIAALLPSLRIARIDPSRALRAE
jgi:ABC-type antimicrobial peptide transport system permease subunit